jgi:hypothetical protein
MTEAEKRIDRLEKDTRTCGSTEHYLIVRALCEIARQLNRIAIDIEDIAPQLDHIAQAYDPILQEDI